ncbi:hypothetical protein [Streptantibioticus ferralitis]|uniref:Uncharacterized protein n=1 Tax=Streptantibioticus ferralitis TaxID=236510 RepID=A0ABT5Z472_9ACTN|nr:hypothetical protein [Streptantibioticus ferralitis]MDF2258361.1 hypothetical protein [Streptantibioticus ferralitis]
MIAQREIENLLICEVDEHFTRCGEDQESYAGLVIEEVWQRQGSVRIEGYDKESGTAFTAIVRVQVTIADEDVETENSQGD